MTPPLVRLTFDSARVEGGALHLEYTLESLASEEVALLDRVPVLPDFSRPPSLAPENAYLGVVDATLVVRKGILPLPPGLRAAERTAPGITLLPPASKRTEAITLPLPVRAFDPHRAAQLRLTTPGAADVTASAPRTCARVRLVVGYFPLGAAKLLPISPEYPDVYRAVPPGAPFASYREVEAETAATVPFEALEYEVIPEPAPPGDAGDTGDQAGDGHAH